MGRRAGGRAACTTRPTNGPVDLRGLFLTLRLFFVLVGVRDNFFGREGGRRLVGDHRWARHMQAMWLANRPWQDWCLQGLWAIVAWWLTLPACYPFPCSHANTACAYPRGHRSNATSRPGCGRSAC